MSLQFGLNVVAAVGVIMVATAGTAAWTRAEEDWAGMVAVALTGLGVFLMAWAIPLMK